MFKSILMTGLFLLSSVGFAQVTHDQAACPDLTGKYKLQGSEEIVVLSSFRDAVGNPNLTVEIGGNATTYALNGETQTMSGGIELITLCFDQKVYDLYYMSGHLIRRDTWALNAERNFVFTTESSGQLGEIVGVRL